MFQKFVYLKPFERVTNALLCSRKCLCTSKEDDNDKKPKEIELSKKVQLTNEVTKKDLQWRTPWHEKEGQHYSFLRAFYSEHSNTSLLKLMQTPINLRPKAIKEWWLRRMDRQNMLMQQYIPERNEILGDELAAAHFIVYRGGAVKFMDEDKWIKANELNQYSLPSHYDSEKFLQAIDCTGVNLYYEGLENFRNLKKLEWINLSGCVNMDDWAMDRIIRGLGALYSLKELKILYVDQMLPYNSFEMTCLMLQDILPNLDIRVV
ncbi:hypothetical protein FQR65_LT04856 [Abscondita terminalis]|nr:hypothetical protein FQR65_LT04856 [Abscondita terminalis]